VQVTKAGCAAGGTSHTDPRNAARAVVQGYARSLAPNGVFVLVTQPTPSQIKARIKLVTSANCWDGCFGPNVFKNADTRNGKDVMKQFVHLQTHTMETCAVVIFKLTGSQPQLQTHKGGA
jgi:hypothetical protein